tara:strand:+ start:255 stop:587 length:333 start_codon:yes stop_codon:yes gene_type:complete
MDYSKSGVIYKIKSRMKVREDISIDQIKGYNRRVKGSPVLQVHIQLIEEVDGKLGEQAQTIRKQREEIKELEMCLKIQAAKAKKVESFLRETYGEKSAEWQSYKSFIIHQ